ncbi:hypothetical protein DFH07DRAFT_956052 [Mycena maculata]|uniref:Uncharacterized protein n=1 Tax=Mycena maculata TaxID=230809 RepID=A0AAD7JKS6_9AGAR|nr:hypothetical protein DFH07DRAFT_956052 [Mycena maculata]
MDCQPAIAALAAPKAQPGQYLLAAFHTSLHRLLRARASFRLGSRQHGGQRRCQCLVDACTKEAALGASTPLMSCLCPLDSSLPLSKAATIAGGIKSFRACWLSEWTTSP